METYFSNRSEAGKTLAKFMFKYKNNPDAIVIALPRGGVPVAFEIAKILNLPLDVLIVRKLGAPNNEELAIGAISINDIKVFSDEIIKNLDISYEFIKHKIKEETKELLRRNQIYRSDKTAIDLENKIVILVDDGIATGANMHAAIKVAKQQNPKKIIIAAPISSNSAYKFIKELVDEIICPYILRIFYGVGSAYDNFTQTSDHEVKALLQQASFFAQEKNLPQINKSKLLNSHQLLIKEIKDNLIDFTKVFNPCDPILKLVNDAHFVLLGESTHGTDEFYHFRAKITKELICNYGFNAIAIEADWPDSYRINRYINGDKTILDAKDALEDFKRFPSWMWRNHAILDFINWLYDYNHSYPFSKKRVGFYGLDIYSLNSSIKAVIDYLDKIDPKAASRARHRYNCFNYYYAQNPQEYGYASLVGVAPKCQKEVINQLMELQKESFKKLQQNGYIDGEELFGAKQNAKVIVDAEQYYRVMFQSNIASWNLRDQHMMETLQDLSAHLSKLQNKRAKIVIWAHNSHIGDASATELSQKGEYNLGQLVKKEYGKDAVLIGFSTYEGSVTAASKWDGKPEYKKIRPAILESYEALFHETNIADFLLAFHYNPKLDSHLNINRLHRAIGVLYLLETERHSHYYFTKLASQFDAIIHFDKTNAVKPLESKGLQK
jgi:erythromycin esterase-like protein/predicted phosphoribosyltransferase